MEQKNQQVIYRSPPGHTSRKCQLQSGYLGLAQAIWCLSKAPTVYLHTCYVTTHVLHSYTLSVLTCVPIRLLHTTPAHDWHELHTYTCSLYLGTKALPRHRKFSGCGLGCSFGCRSSLIVYFSGSAKFTIQPHHPGKYIWTHISHACFGSNRGHIS